jgi:putative ABC transport system permease protein
MRLYRLLLWLLPASFRAEYADEMAAILEARRRDADGPLSRALAFAAAAADVVACAARVHLDILGQDLRYVARSLRRTPGFALTVVAVAALGVGATTAAFSVTDHVLIRPLPFPDPEGLVALWQSNREQGYGRLELSPANFRDWQRLSTSFETMGAFYKGSVNLVDAGDPVRLQSSNVTAEVLPAVGTRPLLGRTFSPEDDREGAAGTLLLSYGLWQDRFAGDPAVLGRKLLLDDEPYQVIGVMPAGFHYPRRETQLWLPMRFQADAFERRGDLFLDCVARLKPDVSIDAARAELTLLTAQLERQYPKENRNVGGVVVRLREELSRQSRLLLLALFGAALGVLLIACTNLAGLFLARALERRQELAVRTALGAGRERLARQLLTESLLLGGAGGVLGVLLALAALPLVVRLVPNALPIGEMPPLDLRVLAFAGLMTLLSAVGFGLAPAWRGLDARTSAGLREGARGGQAGRERVRSLLVVAEVTVAVVLLISCGLLIRALLRVQAVAPGFDPAQVVTVRTSLPMPKYQKLDKRNAFHASVLDEVRALPGVTSAAYISFLPMVMTGGIWSIEAEGHPTQPDEGRTASVRYVTPGYFATLRIPLVAGRDVSDSDTAGALQVAVVSRSFVERYWPGQNPIGRRFRFGPLGGGSISTSGDFQNRTVVGVVDEVKVRGPERRNEPQVYLPNRQQPEDAMSWYTPQDLAVRHTGEPGTIVTALRKIVARADPALPVTDVRTLEAIVEGQTAPRRVQVRVLAGFAALAVLLAGVGIHGLLAFTVASRSQELGVRRALGARTSDILRLVVRHGLRLAALGTGLGLALAWAVGRSLEALLAGVSPQDLATSAAAAFLALATALAGTLVPAWRAARVDPLKVIRVD